MGWHRDGRTVLHHLVKKQCEGLESTHRLLVESGTKFRLLVIEAVSAGARILKDRFGRDPCDLCVSPSIRSILNEARLNPTKYTTHSSPLSMDLILRASSPAISSVKNDLDVGELAMAVDDISLVS